MITDVIERICDRTHVEQPAQYFLYMIICLQKFAIHSLIKNGDNNFHLF